MAGRGSDGADDALADPRQDCFFPRPTHQQVDVGPNRDPRHGQQLNVVLGHRGHLGRGGEEGGQGESALVSRGSNPSGVPKSTTRLIF